MADIDAIVRLRRGSRGTPKSRSQAAAELTSGLAAAWNQHDMREFASLFHDDAAFVNVAGAYLHGRGQIELTHTVMHAGPFRNSILTAWPEDAHGGL